MSQGDDPERPTSRFPKRPRVTLKWDASPLALPEEPGGEAVPPEPSVAPVPGVESSHLALPVIDPEADAEALSRVESKPPSVAPPELVDGVDAWERQLPTLTPPPFRPPSSVPPPLLEEDEGGALDLVDWRSRPAIPVGDLAVEMSDRYALGDYTAALRIAELLIGKNPDDELANRTAEGCRERLLALYRSRLGSLARVPRVAVDNAQVRWLGLDHRAAFLLSRVDGDHTLAELVDVSSMPRVEALKTLVELLELGAIRFAD